MECRDGVDQAHALIEDVAAVVLDHQRHRIARREGAAVGLEQDVDALAGDGGADEEEDEPIGVAGARARPEVEARSGGSHQGFIDAKGDDLRLRPLDAARGRLLRDPTRVHPELVADVVHHLGETPRIGPEVPGAHRDQTRGVWPAQLAEVVAVVVMDDPVVAAIELGDRGQQVDLDARSR